jgi:acyl-CoA reductase-like NAD-dependent aldehyde dehydrogenase
MNALTESRTFLYRRQWTKPSSSATIDVINSATEELFARVAEAQEADVDRAVAAARKAFDHGPWPRMSHAERATYLRAIASELDKRVDEGAVIWTTESGLIHSTAKTRTAGLSATYNYYAGLADTYPFQERRTPAAGGVGLLVREPVGVVGAIIPGTDRQA